MEKATIKRVSHENVGNKSSALIWLTLVTWLSVSILNWYFFSIAVFQVIEPTIIITLKLVYLPWTMFWLWGIHNFWHQTFSCLRRSQPLPLHKSPASDEVVILYTTCDDFEPFACRSCLEQTYAAVRLIICDDSTTAHSRLQIDAFASQYGSRVTVTRRPDRYGFKAGNINYVLTKFVHEEFVVLCDADEVLPPTFVADLIPYLQEESLVFVQARHQVRNPAATRFSSLLGHVTNIFFDYSLPLRNRFGFVSCFGHGVMFRRSLCLEIGGFPLMASEDLAFASRALAAGYRGLYVEQITAEEAFPASYTALLKKYRRVVEGTIEYFHDEFPRLIKSRKATWTEKADLLLTYSACYVGMVGMLNLIGGLIIICVNHVAGYSRLEMWLLIVYLIGPFTPVVPMIVCIPRSPVQYVRMFFSAAIAYASLLPMLALRGTAQILSRHPTVFEPTGKIGRQRQRFHEHFLTQATGICILCIALGFRSPAIIPAAGLGLMFILGPVLCLSERSHGLGALARNSGFIPFAVMGLLLFWWD